MVAADKPTVMAAPASKMPRSNPYATLWAEALRDAGVEVRGFSTLELFTGRFRAVHFHWPEYELSLVRRGPHRLALRIVRLLGLWVARRRGAAVTWTMHNVRPHDRSLSLIDRALMNSFYRQLDAVMVLTYSSVDRVAHVIGREGVVTLVAPHPLYPQEVPSTTHLQHKFQYVTIGEMRRYRGHLDLVRHFKSARFGNETLLIVGEDSKDAYCKELRAAVDETPNVEWLPIRPSDEELARLVDESRGVILWYSSILNSGAALLALSRKRPVVLPASPEFEELRDDYGNNWVFLVPRTPKGLRTALDRLSRDRQDVEFPSVPAREWSHTAQVLLDALVHARSAQG